MGQQVKHIRVVSPRLSAWWGREIWLGAQVLLPKGFDDHPEAQYPLMLCECHLENFEGECLAPILGIGTHNIDASSLLACTSNCAIG